MSLDNPLRWQQRLNSFSQAFEQLKSAVELSKSRKLSDLERQGLIQAFEFTHELAWNVMKDYLDYQGANQITGSRDATREAFQKSLIKNGELWMEMIKSRNQSSHTYNQETAEEIAGKITDEYFAAFAEFIDHMNVLLGKVK